MVNKLTYFNIEDKNMIHKNLIQFFVITLVLHAPNIILLFLFIFRLFKWREDVVYFLTDTGIGKLYTLIIFLITIFTFFNYFTRGIKILYEQKQHKNVLLVLEHVITICLIAFATFISFAFFIFVYSGGTHGI
jgi:hypothetical protein